MRQKTIVIDSPLPTGFLPRVRFGGWARLFIVYSAILALGSFFLFVKERDSHHPGDREFYERHKTVVQSESVSPLVLKLSIDALKNLETTKEERTRQIGVKFLGLWFWGSMLALTLGLLARWIAKSFKVRSSAVAGEGQAGAPGGSGPVEKL